MEKFIISVIQLNCETHVLNKFNAPQTEVVKSLVFYCENPPSHYLNKLEYFIRPIKKHF